MEIKYKIKQFLARFFQNYDLKEDEDIFALGFVLKPDTKPAIAMQSLSTRICSHLSGVSPMIGDLARTEIICPQNFAERTGNALAVRLDFRS